MVGILKAKFSHSYSKKEVDLVSKVEERFIGHGENKNSRYNIKQTHNLPWEALAPENE